MRIDVVSNRKREIFTRFWRPLAAATWAWEMSAFGIGKHAALFSRLETISLEYFWCTDLFFSLQLCCCLSTCSSTHKVPICVKNRSYWHPHRRPWTTEQCKKWIRVINGVAITGHGVFIRTGRFLLRCALFLGGSKAWLCPCFLAATTTHAYFTLLGLPTTQVTSLWC